ncbi:MAG: Ni/Fe-hydrogenase, b-type cytochrome subunit [Gemmatimonadota bacterium]
MSAGPRIASGEPTFLGREVPAPVGNYKWVYLWGLPIRAMHWIAAVCVVTLAVTGLYIGRPYFMGNPAEPGQIMTRFRLAHYLAATFLVMTGIVRVYWLFAGNRFERLKALFPIRRRDIRNLFRMIGFYLMIQPEKAPRYLGHNPLQQLNYTLVYLVATLEVITGVILFSQAVPTGIMYRLVNWMTPLFGGLQNVRFIHHVITWFFVIFIPAHVYLAFRADVIGGGGTVSSIITGGRFFEADRHYEDE